MYIYLRQSNIRAKFNKADYTIKQVFEQKALYRLPYEKYNVLFVTIRKNLETTSVLLSFA